MEAALRAENSVGPAAPSPGLERFLQLLSVLQRSKGGAPASGLFAFTSAIRGEGVSYVATALAREMALLPRERVLLAQASVLTTLTARDVDENSNALREVSPQLWIAPAAPVLVKPAGPDFQPDLLDALRRRFTYVLVDCRALQSSPEILRIAPQVDGVVLVVGAGFSGREQVLNAQKVLQLASDKLLGCVLNRQTQPTRKFFDRYFDKQNGAENDTTS